MAGLDIAEAYLESLVRSQRVSKSDLTAYQDKLLRALVKHAHGSTPFYVGRVPAPESLTPVSEYWREQPFVTRKHLTEHFDLFRPNNFDRLHGIIMPVSTGGSTGPAARRDLTSLESVGRLLASYRMYHDWKLDQSRPLFVLRKTRREEASGNQSWGYPWLAEEERGRRTWIDIATPARVQLQAMTGQGAVYVNNLPSNILRLVVEAMRSGVQLRIPHIISVGEYLAPEVRSAAAEVFGSKIIDAFSSAEGGVMAIQCPEAGLYHIQSEQLVLEVIREDRTLCDAGETGEAVVTPLYAYATPLLRYRSGDFVEVGPTCSCGRVLPTISRIAGRREHMFLHPDGGLRLPAINRVTMTLELGHDNWRLVQTGHNTVELRHVGDIEARSADLLLEHLREALWAACQVVLRQVQELPLTSGGKRHFTANELASARS